MIKLGADINIKDDKHETVLMKALGKHGSPEISRILLDSGVDVIAGETPRKTIFSYFIESKYESSKDIYRRITEQFYSRGVKISGSEIDNAIGIAVRADDAVMIKMLQEIRPLP